MGKETSVDYYEILQVSPTADQEMIERAFRLLAKRYHPDNIHTGDAAKFDTLMEAYRVLSVSEKRAVYDDTYKYKAADGADQNSILFNAPQPRDPGEERKIHQVILFIVYAARRRDVMKPGVGAIELEKLAGLPEKELEFHIWYLKEKGWIQRLDTGEFAITASGVDTIMGNNPILRRDRLLPSANELSKASSDNPSDQLSN
jgi:curved DNA-binding protein